MFSLYKTRASPLAPNVCTVSELNSKRGRMGKEPDLEGILIIVSSVLLFKGMRVFAGLVTVMDGWTKVALLLSSFCLRQRRKGCVCIDGGTGGHGLHFIQIVTGMNSI